MKLTYYFRAIILLVIFSAPVFSQFTDYKSVVAPSPFYSPVPNGTKSLVVTTNDFDNFYLGVDFGEPYIATNPRDPLNSFCAFNIAALSYTLDGYTWIRNNPGFSVPVIGDPVMTYDSLGNAFYVQLYQAGATYGLAVVKSSNKCITWQPSVSIFSTNAGLCDKEWITADQTNGPFSNNLYLGWRQFGGSGMRFVRSTDHGNTWSSPLTFNGQQGAYVAVGANGNVQGGSVYFAAINGGAIVVNRSTDGGQTFSPQVVAVGSGGPGVSCYGRNTVKNCIRTDGFPRMAADNSFTSTRGNVYVVIADNPAGPDNADIYLAKSTDFGLTWLPRVRVNDDAGITDQWMPSVSVDNITGKIFIQWFDSREDPSGNLQTKLYGCTSTDGGNTFTTNAAISDVLFNPNNMAVGQGTNEANYMGDYIGISAIRNTSYAVWMDARANNLGSYTGYYPDFAMNANPPTSNLSNGDSVTITAKVPAIKGPYSGRVRFTAALDTLPVSGSLNISFVNGKDSITTFPDSVKIRIKAVGNVTPKLYSLIIKGSGPNGGIPVHVRTLNLLVNSSFLTVGTNRNGSAEFRVNGITYTTLQQLPFPNGSSVNVQAVSPFTIGTKRYIFLNWSDGGDTSHNIIINSNLNLTANFKTQFKMIMNSSQGNTFGGNNFYDSAQAFSFGVLSREIGGHHFLGWDGAGPGAYTSPDSTGNDSLVTLSINNVIVETVRWTGVIGIQNISSEIPQVYKLYQNYPNPFNPTTTINFDIIKAGNVKITLYDILGKEVITVVNENVQPGKYRTTFNAENLASGLYFYKIATNDFTDIKKLVVIK